MIFFFASFLALIKGVSEIDVMFLFSALFRNFFTKTFPTLPEASSGRQENGEDQEEAPLIGKRRLPMFLSHGVQRSKKEACS
jgi:hypothetical protein